MGNRQSANTPVSPPVRLRLLRDSWPGAKLAPAWSVARPSPPAVAMPAPVPELGAMAAEPPGLVPELALACS